MANPGAKLKKKLSYILIKKASSAVCLLSIMLFIFCGIWVGVDFMTILVRCILTCLVIYLVSVILVHILIAYEEMNSGKT